MKNIIKRVPLWLHLLIAVIVVSTWTWLYVLPSLKVLSKTEINRRDLKDKIKLLKAERVDFSYSDKVETELMNAVEENFRVAVPASSSDLSKKLVEKSEGWPADIRFSITDRGRLLKGTGEPLGGCFILAEKKSAVIFRDKLRSGLKRLAHLVGTGVRIYPYYIELIAEEGKVVFVLKGETFHLTEGELPVKLEKRRSAIIDSSSEILKQRITREMLLKSEIEEIK